jgi:hypothetical protein
MVVALEVSVDHLAGRFVGGTLDIHAAGQRFREPLPRL